MLLLPVNKIPGNQIAPYLHINTLVCL